MPRPFLLLLVTGSLLTATAGAQTRKVDCSDVLAQLKRDFAARPGRLALAVEDALTVSEACACPIIQQAAELAGRDPVLTGELVAAALRVAPSAAATIVECALDRVPEASSNIRGAIDRVLGERASDVLAANPKNSQLQTDAVEVTDVSGKEPIGKGPVGKQPVGKEPLISVDTEDFESIVPVGLSGIYLFSPATRGGIVERETRRTIVKVVKRERIVIKPSIPATPSHPVSPPD